MSTRVLHRNHRDLRDQRQARLAGTCLAAWLAATGANVQATESPVPVAQEGKVWNVPADMIEAAMADAAQRSTTASGDITVVDASAVTWPDGSLGCPQPGMAYTQALVAGYRIVLRAGDVQLNYHASSRGKPLFCPAARVRAPTTDDRT